MSERGLAWVRRTSTGEFFDGAGRIYAISILPGSAGNGVNLHDALSANEIRQIGRWIGAANRTTVYNFPKGIEVEVGCWGVFGSNTDEVTVFYRLYENI